MTETVRSFKIKLAGVLTRLGAEQAFVRTDASRMADYLGIPRPVAKGTDWEIPEIAEETHIDGRPLSAYSAEFLAEHESKRLAVLRHDAYDKIRDYVYDEYISEEAGTRMLEELGLPVPKVVTSVRASLHGVSGEMIFTLDGEHTREEVVALLEPHAVDPVGDAVRTAFPDVSGLRPKVRATVNRTTVWPPLFEVGEN